MKSVDSVESVKSVDSVQSIESIDSDKSVDSVDPLKRPLAQKCLESQAPHGRCHHKCPLTFQRQEMTAPHFNRSFEFRKVRATSL